LKLVFSAGRRGLGDRAVPRRAMRRPQMCAKAAASRDRSDQGHESLPCLLGHEALPAFVPPCIRDSSLNPPDCVSRTSLMALSGTLDHILLRFLQEMCRACLARRRLAGVIVERTAPKQHNVTLWRTRTGQERARITPSNGLFRPRRVVHALHLGKRCTQRFKTRPTHSGRRPARWQSLVRRHSPRL
jgi:hypothetical protein